tara:strand:- start:604 stop:1350 length:747 start_codon:yes stop_codon:yes gene_type:complete
MLPTTLFFCLCASAFGYQLPSMGGAARANVDRHQLLHMRAEAGITMAKDIKGKAIWDLRLAAPSDSEAIAELCGTGYTKEMISPLVQRGLCVVGESGRSLVSAALVHTYKGVRENGKIDENAELLCVTTAGGVPKELAGEIRMKTAQGSLKNLKAKQFSQVVCTFPAAAKENVEFVTSLQLQPMQSADKEVAKFCANLMAMNPDPQKKLKDAPVPIKQREAVVEVPKQVEQGVVEPVVAEEAPEPVAA